jgi:hypothetical protein
MSDLIKAYHRTEALRPSGFIAKVEIEGVLRPLRDDAQVFTTREAAQAREVELADKWKFDHAPCDAIIKFLN